MDILRDVIFPMYDEAKRNPNDFNVRVRGPIDVFDFIDEIRRLDSVVETQRLEIVELGGVADPLAEESMGG